MRLLVRTAAPAILARRSADWTAAFLASSDARPDPKKYRHDHVVDALRGMSHNKCFYCERPLADGEEQVDHYVEVSCARDRAFVWQNLYLACKGCNVGKPDDKDIPVAGCVDPCGVVPVEQHLEFVHDQVRAVSASDCGERTIRKYRLLRPQLQHQRMQVLKQLWLEYQRILNRRLAENGRAITADELARLRAYADATAPFSACCAAWLRSVEL